MHRILLLVGWGLFLASTPAAAVEYFHAELGPRPGVETGATGLANFELDADRGELTFSISISGLESEEIAAHIHRGDGEILHQLPLGNQKDGVWFGLGPADLFLLREGDLFVLIHTLENNGGEIRGDILGGRVSVGPASLGEFKRRYGESDQR